MLISFVFPQFTSFHSVFHSFHGLMNSINWPDSSVWVFISQAGQHCSANAEATRSNPVEAPKNFFSGYFRNCLNCDSLRWSHIHFICIPAAHIISFCSPGFSCWDRLTKTANWSASSQLTCTKTPLAWCLRQQRPLLCAIKSQNAFDGVHDQVKGTNVPVL